MPTTTTTTDPVEAAIRANHAIGREFTRAYRIPRSKQELLSLVNNTDVRRAIELADFSTFPDPR